jgi:hypothetical protein
VDLVRSSDQWLSLFKLAPQISKGADIAELKVRLIWKGLPVASPLETDLFSDLPNLSIKWRILKIVAAVEQANIPGDPEVVIGMAWTGLSHDSAGLGASLRENICLFLVGTRARDNSDDDDAKNPGLIDGFHELTCKFLRLGMKRYDAGFSALVKPPIFVGDLI